MRTPDIREYLPSIFLEIKEIQVLADADNPELKLLWDSVDNARADQFLYTMTEYGISRWEKILGITPMGTDTIEDRRFRVISRLSVQLPYTYDGLDAHLKNLCGEGKYNLSIDYPNFELTLKLSLESKNMRAEVERLVNEMIPMNMIFTLELIFNTYNKLKAFTHNQLKAFTHSQLREETL